MKNYIERKYVGKHIYKLKEAGSLYSFSLALRPSKVHLIHQLCGSTLKKVGRLKIAATHMRLSIYLLLFFLPL